MQLISKALLSICFQDVFRLAALVKPSGALNRIILIQNPDQSLHFNEFLIKIIIITMKNRLRWHVIEPFYSINRSFLQFITACCMHAVNVYTRMYVCTGDQNNIVIRRSVFYISFEQF